MKKIITLILLGLFTSQSSSQITKIENLNSEFFEFFPTVSPNGEMLCFCSLRGGQPWSEMLHFIYQGKKQFDGDLYCAKKRRGIFQNPVAMSGAINTKSREDEVTISVDGQIVYWESWDPDWIDNGGPYYYATLEGDNWQNRSGLGGGITEFIADQMKKQEERIISDVENSFSEKLAEILIQYYYSDFPKFLELFKKFGPFDPVRYSHVTEGMTVSPDGNTLIVSTRDFKADQLNFDLYISTKSNGEWSYPRAMSELNTKYDEVTPSINGDYRTVYFASNRSGGLGGYDMYKVDIDNLDEVKNIGYPYNSEYDEYGLVMNSLALDGEGYLIRDGDIYKVEPNELIASRKTILIDGEISNYKGQKIAKEVSLKTSHGVSLQYQTNSVTGMFSFATPYIEPDTLLISISTIHGDLTQRVAVNDTSVFPIKVKFFIPFQVPNGDTILQKTLYFKPMKSEIEQAHKDILREVKQIASKQSHITIIEGHTNNLPMDDITEPLSMDRARNTYTELKRMGLSVDNLEYLGHGDTQPKSSNKTFRGRKENQRTEITVIKLNTSN